ncbi:MAG: 50S ribosomal protein L24 [Deltaproteobacteria bacterium RIFCSPLOWO2_12_FULL_43_16]|nr:MAG: 50S ribosomal protein L24 [Deltaproteobacteria bacterium GWA2_43_19]OGQ10924.1 MAG: 50S ribosomal protein L24 [Deltaproteobacteria bacterium RIFCSPHIGHO2_02_FULL_43_33]OGQ60937.1 MAG: 50S ribosomal protein L24 [Deltaproteobacteria bacterium RIFCSPLOWO2_12_FULL_43_16]HBR17342.1 50S ribosomal protein L24 [Deltaproteobacteria bacterium]
MQVVKYKIKKNDNVMIVSGREKGKTGKVVKVIPEKAHVLIEKLNMVKRHVKPSNQYKQGGIIEKEAPLAISNVMLICDKCRGPVRVGKKVLDGGKKVRYCKKCGEVLDK